MLNFFKNNQNKVTVPEVKPMSLWEENSFMQVLSDSVEKYTLDGEVEKRIKEIEGVELIDFTVPKPDENGNMVLTYKGEEYGVGFYFDNFELDSLYSVQSQQIHKEDFEQLGTKTKVFVLFMKFHKDPLVSYHLQLKLLAAFFPDMLAVADESAERLLSGRWVRLAAESDTLPSADSLFTVQAVSGDDRGQKVWLHTHGLCRAGFSELEIVDVEDVNTQYYLLNTTANRMIYENKEIGNYIFIGEFLDGEPIVVTSLPWNKGISKYPAGVFGGANDRVESHNTNSSLLFLYLTEDDANNNRYTKPTDANKRLENNPLYYYTNAQTDRMKAEARERFELLKNAVINSETEYNVLIKIGLPTDGEDGKIDYENLEHIWFELIEFTENGFRARLTQEPYRVSSMKEGDEGEYTVNDVTDWTLYRESGAITPNTAYLL